MRIGIIGGGVIARLILEHARHGGFDDARIVGILGRNDSSRGKPLAREFGVAFATTVEAFVGLEPDLVIEAASHDAVRQYAAALLEAGIPVIVMSSGALCDDALRSRLEIGAARGGTLLYVPSGGIGGLDALKAACAAGVDDAEIVITKPPVAWKNVPFVEGLGIDLDCLTGDALQRHGARRRAALSGKREHRRRALDGRRRFRSYAVEGRRRSRARMHTHYINIRGKTGSISIKFESVPSPDNPKTWMLACYSAVAAVKALVSPVRYGT